MKLVTFTRDRWSGVGVMLDADRVLDLTAAAGDDADIELDARSMLGVIRGGSTALKAIRELTGAAPPDAIHALRDVTLEAPIPKPPRNVFCVGRNYVDHVAEGARAMGLATNLPKVPQFFTKATHTIIGPGTTVQFNPKVSDRMDYEVELGVVIGRTARDIPAKAAFDHIFGYTIVNDVSARDIQRLHEQWFKGKSLDTCCPMGPCIVTRDEIPDVSALELSITINGERRQHAHVSQMIFDIPHIVESLSAGMTLEAGDVIATGTPSGVGFAMEPPKFLKDGDEMVCTISQIGTLRNRIAERA